MAINSVSFPFFWAAQPEAWRPNLCWDMFSFQHLLFNSNWLNRGSWGPPLLGAGSLYCILSPTNSNFVCTELYYCFTPTQFNPSTVKVIPRHPRPDALVIYTGEFLILTAWPGRRSIYNNTSRRILPPSRLDFFRNRDGALINLQFLFSFFFFGDHIILFPSQLPL